MSTSRPVVATIRRFETHQAIVHVIEGPRQVLISLDPQTMRIQYFGGMKRGLKTDFDPWDLPLIEAARAAVRARLADS